MRVLTENTTALSALQTTYTKDLQRILSNEFGLQVKSARPARYDIFSDPAGKNTRGTLCHYFVPSPFKKKEPVPALFYYLLSSMPHGDTSP